MGIFRPIDLINVVASVALGALIVLAIAQSLEGLI